MGFFQDLIPFGYSTRKGAFRALDRLRDEGVIKAWDRGIVVGGPYSSGALVGGPNFEYAPARPEILDRVARIKTIADRHGASMKTAGLQFALANPAVAAVIPGASQPGRVAEDRAALNEVVPAHFWRELRRAGLVSPAAPLPIAD
ncbi:aldo/keto reductase [Sorangium sp. So ce887]